MKLNHLLIISGAVMSFMACEPLDESSWVGNALSSVEWKQVTGDAVRPADADTLVLRFIPQTADNVLYEFPMPGDKGAFDVLTGCYDVLAVTGGYAVTGLEHLKTATLTLPYTTGIDKVKVIPENPQMTYAGHVRSFSSHSLRQTSLSVPMRKLMKRIHFVLNVGHTGEVRGDCRAELGGMAVQLSLSGFVPCGTDEAVQRFTLTKQGRHWNQQHCLTTFKGSVNVMGVQGTNILRFTFVDGEGDMRSIETDISPFLANWSTDEVTMRLAVRIEGEEARLTLDGFELGDTTDFEI